MPRNPIKPPVTQSFETAFQLISAQLWARTGKLRTTGGVTFAAEARVAEDGRRHISLLHGNRIYGGIGVSGIAAWAMTAGESARTRCPSANGPGSASPYDEASLSSAEGCDLAAITFSGGGGMARGCRPVRSEPSRD